MKMAALLTDVFVRFPYAILIYGAGRLTEKLPALKGEYGYETSKLDLHSGG